MSTWISSAALGLLAAAALSACQIGGESRVVRLAPLPGQATGFAVEAPAGFCAAEGGARQVGQSEFVAFARCARAVGPAMLLTATVGLPGSGTEDEPDPAAVAAFLTSDAGRRMLSRAGSAEAITVHEVLRTEAAVLVRLTDRSPGRAGQPVGESWRAVLSLAGRLVTLSATPGEGAGDTPRATRTAIDAFVAAMRSANRRAT